MLEAMDDLLAERGFAGVTIEGIVTAAGVVVGACVGYARTWGRRSTGSAGE